MKTRCVPSARFRSSWPSFQRVLYTRTVCCSARLPSVSAGKSIRAMFAIGLQTIASSGASIPADARRTELLAAVCGSRTSADPPLPAVLGDGPVPRLHLEPAQRGARPALRAEVAVDELETIAPRDRCAGR